MKPSKLILSILFGKGRSPASSVTKTAKIRLVRLFGLIFPVVPLLFVFHFSGSNEVVLYSLLIFNLNSKLFSN